MALQGPVRLLVCLAIVDDPDTLHSLSQRIRTLSALALVDREMHSMMRDFVYPILIKRAVTNPSAGEPPTLEVMASMTDMEVDRIMRVNCISNTRITSRALSVARIMEVIASDHWRLVPLKRELRKRRRVFISTMSARVEFRLRPCDLSQMKTVRGCRREDVLDACMARFESSAKLGQYNLAVTEAANKRSDTRAVRVRRKSDLAQLTGNAEEWVAFRAKHQDLVDAEKAYQRSGTAEDAQTAVRLLHQRSDEVAGRRQEMELLGWPPQLPVFCNLIPAGVKAAYDRYLHYSRGEDKVTAQVFLEKWMVICNGCDVIETMRCPVLAEAIHDFLSF